MLSTSTLPSEDKIRNINSMFIDILIDTIDEDMLDHTCRIQLLEDHAMIMATDITKARTLKNLRSIKPPSHRLMFEVRTAEEKFGIDFLRNRVNDLANTVYQASINSSAGVKEKDFCFRINSQETERLGLEELREHICKGYLVPRFPLTETNHYILMMKIASGITRS